MAEVSLYVAFGAGLISFLSPCVLPLVPGYISFISGTSIQKLKTSEGPSPLSVSAKRAVIFNALFFIAGFSIVFILLGASATWIGALLTSRLNLFTKIAGLTIIFFGLVKTGLIRWLFLQRDMRVNIDIGSGGRLGAVFLGASFAFGWTPCIGPVLGSILLFAGTIDDLGRGIVLLALYSLGLGIPFFLTALGIDRFLRFFARIKRYLGIIEVSTGVILMVLGVMVYTNSLARIPGYLTFFNRFAW